MKNIFIFHYLLYYIKIIYIDMEKNAIYINVFFFGYSILILRSIGYEIQRISSKSLGLY